MKHLLIVIGFALVTTQAFGATHSIDAITYTCYSDLKPSVVVADEEMAWEYNRSWEFNYFKYAARKTVAGDALQKGMLLDHGALAFTPLTFESMTLKAGPGRIRFGGSTSGRIQLANREVRILPGEFRQDQDDFCILAAYGPDTCFTLANGQSPVLPMKPEWTLPGWLLRVSMESESAGQVLCLGEVIKGPPLR